jgi:AbrB family looped-hinge helix DNA binding protein
MATLEQSVKPQLHAKTVLAPNGRIVIPAAIRQELGFKPGETLLMDVQAGVLRIESYPVRIQRIQHEIAERLKPTPGILASDELIAERREEARREEEELQRDLEGERQRSLRAGQVV